MDGAVCSVFLVAYIKCGNSTLFNAIATSVQASDEADHYLAYMDSHDYLPVRIWIEDVGRSQFCSVLSEFIRDAYNLLIPPFKPSYV